jgi:SH2 domain-containing protein 4A
MPLLLCCAVQRKEHLDEDGKVYPWFHGLLTRQEAENMLFDSDNGVFMLRVSDKANGYALSVRYEGRFRHYRVIHATDVLNSCFSV